MIGDARALDSGVVEAGELRGRNTYVEVCEATLAPVIRQLEAAVAEGEAGTRLTVVTSPRLAGELLEAGFEVLRHVPVGAEAVRAGAGGRGCASCGLC